MVRDNDQTKNMAAPAVIIAAIRSGGTFLSHCLSNHTQIYCDRGEPLHHLSVWASLKRDRRKILAALLNQPGYKVSMCRLTYTQAFEQDVWPWLVKLQPRVIWLRRENMLRQAISVYLNQMVRREGNLKRPVHTFKPARPVKVTIEPELFLKHARGLAEQNELAKARMENLERVYPLTYVDVVGGDGRQASATQLPLETTRKLCAFLGVRFEPLGCDLQRVNPFPLSELIANWAQVERVVRKSEFADQLENI